jgi:hypothetical protein
MRHFFVFCSSIFFLIFSEGIFSQTIKAGFAYLKPVKVGYCFKGISISYEHYSDTYDPVGIFFKINSKYLIKSKEVNNGFRRSKRKNIELAW